MHVLNTNPSQKVCVYHQNLKKSKLQQYGALKLALLSSIPANMLFAIIVTFRILLKPNVFQV